VVGINNLFFSLIYFSIGQNFAANATEYQSTDYLLSNYSNNKIKRAALSAAQITDCIEGDLYKVT
jgi:hypothetical protein